MNTPGTPDNRDNGRTLFAFEVQQANVAPPPEAGAGDTAEVTTVPRRRLNTALAVALMLIVSAAPLPLGSNRPVFWLGWAAILFFLAAIYLAAITIRRLPLRASPWQYPVISASALLFALYGFLQTVPLGEGLLGLLPLGATAPAGPAISIAPSATLVGILRWTSYAVFFLLMMQVAQNRTRARKLAWFVFFLVTGQAAFALLSFRFLGETLLTPTQGYSGVISGTFVNRNSFATFTGMGAILGLALLLHDLRTSGGRSPHLASLLSVESIRRAAAWICLAVVLGALFATGSRMGITASVIALFLVAVVSFAKGPKRTPRWAFFTFVLAFATIGMLLAIFGQTAIERAIFTLGGKDGRFDLYVQTLELLRTRPWLGFGFDTFGLAFEQVHRPPVSPDLVWNRAHSTYLALWVEMGLVFGSLPLVIGAALMVRLARIVLAAPRDFVLAIAGLGVMVLAALHSLVDFSLEMSANVFLFLTIVALAAGTRLRPGAQAAKRGTAR